MEFFQNVAQRHKDMEKIQEKFKDLECFNIITETYKKGKGRMGEKNTVRDKNVFFKMIKGAI